MTWLSLPTVPRAAASRGPSMLHCWVTCTLLFYAFCDLVGYLNRQTALNVLCQGLKKL